MRSCRSLSRQMHPVPLMADERSSARVARPSLFHRRPARPFALSIDSRPTDFIVALATLAKAANELHTGASDECSGSTLRVRRIGPCPRVYHFGIRGRRHSPLFFATNDTLARERERESSAAVGRVNNHRSTSWPRSRSISCLSSWSLKGKRRRRKVSPRHNLARGFIDGYIQTINICRGGA